MYGESAENKANYDSGGFIYCTPFSMSNTNLQSSSSKQPELLSGLQRFAVEKYVEQLISTPNYLAYLIETPGYSSVNYEYEYDRFLDYVENCSEPEKSQLTELLYPLFVHLYLLMLRLYPDSESSVYFPHIFYEKFSSIFLDETESYKTHLEQLFGLESIKAAENHPDFKDFCAQKYVAKVSIDVIKNLRSFLKKIKSKVLQFVFHFYFYFEDVDIPVQDEDYERNCNLNFNSNDRHSDTKSKYDQNETESKFSVEVLEYNIPNFSSADVNKDETKISIACNSHILTATLDHSNHEETELPGVLTELPGVSVVKYIQNESDVLIAAYGSDVILIDFTKGIEKCFQSLHMSYIWNLDVNSSGRLFATVSKDTTACIWNLNEGTPVGQFCSHTDDVTAVNFHPNDYYFATGSADLKVLLFSVDDTCPIQCCEGLTSKITSIRFSPDGKLLAASDLCAVKIWSLEDNKPKFLFPESEASSCNICFDDITHEFAVCNTKGIFRIYDLRYVNGNECIVSKNIEYTPLFMNYNSQRKQVWKIIVK